MKIFHGIQAVSGKFKNGVIAIGVFDGLHLGHQLLIRKAIHRAKALAGTAIVMTFDPHPVHVLRPENHLPLLISLDYRLQLLEELGVDVAVVVRFTKAFSHLAPEQFILRYLLKPFAPLEVIVGDDFRFGQNRQGTIEVFKEASQRYGFNVLSVRTQKRGVKKFSSSAVRELIGKGELSQAARILGRPVSLMGDVERGEQRGKTLGFPTVNINPSGELLPPLGVYTVRIHYRGKIYLGMANVGVRPSFRKTERINVEVHIFDFHKKIYGQRIVIEFLHKVRNERYFPSSKDLIAQLNRDELYCRKWFARQRIV